jgi:hypothetical protein
MTLICYKEKNFRQASRDLIDTANGILREYQAGGYTLTLRQLYYQFVSRNIIPNNEKSYDNLGVLITDARLAGLVSWTAIEDRGRTPHPPYIQGDVVGALDGIEYAYAPDLWEGQENYVEIWVEKEALANVVERPASRWHVTYMACKGYLSASEAWRAANRFQEAASDGKRCYMLHLGDHDPSGMDMTRDNRDRLNDIFGVDVEVIRLALNMDQVDQYNPPPNPAKVTDSRAANYIAQYGRTSWELDALEPAVLDALIDRNIRALLDIEAWNDRIGERDEKRENLRYISQHADDALNWAAAQGGR